MTHTLDSKFSTSRRSFLVAASALGALSAIGAKADSKDVQLVRWTGAALGAKASINLYHSDPVWAREQLDKCQREIERFENLFSLYRPQSAVRQLNRDGFLENPDVDFLTLLSQAIAFSEQTSGVFDVTVQPLWELYATHFSSLEADPEGPPSDVISTVLERVGSRHVQLDTDQISFTKKGMGITLNGIAQGYITDRITELLKSAGFTDVLVSLGESYGLGGKPDGSDWTAGIVSPQDGKTILKRVHLRNRAIATSGGYGSPFSPNSQINHLINPRDGQTAVFNRSVSVIADQAVKADMASTALSLMDHKEANYLVQADAGIKDVIYL